MPVTKLDSKAALIVIDLPLRGLFKGTVRSINDVPPSRQYKGQSSDDEGYYHVLQGAWENYVMVVTGDGARVSSLPL